MRHIFEFSIARLREAIATLKVTQALEHLRLKAGFDPNQPRVPAGNPDGGQWTATAGSGGGRAGAGRQRGNPSDGRIRQRVVRDSSRNESWRSRVDLHRSDGSLAGQAFVGRDGSSVETVTRRRNGPGDSSQRHVVSVSDGPKITFRNEGERFSVYDSKDRLLTASVWTPSGPVSIPVVQQVAMTSGQAEHVLDAGRALYNALSAQSGPEQRACFAFRAWNYEKKPATELLYSGIRTREEVQAVCTQLERIQKMTNTAAQKVGPPSNHSSPAVYGTKVHSELEKIVKAQRKPNLKAERSYTKAGIETGRIAGTIRIDVLEERDDGTLCIYDIKTGKRGLAMSRVREFALRTSKRLEGYRDIVVIEVRPFEE